MLWSAGRSALSCAVRMEPFGICRRVVWFIISWYFILTNCVSSDEEVLSSPAVLGGSFPLSRSASFLGELEEDHCLELLHLFGQRYSSLVSCLVSSARPVKVCQNCYTDFNDVNVIYNNISTNEMGPGNVSCNDVLMRSDRLLLLYNLYSSVQDIWLSSACDQCLTKDSLSNTTVYFFDTLNQTLTCFNRYQPANYSELCKVCRAPYTKLSELYSGISGNDTLCIDIEDAMNMTRHLWSKSYNCSFPREETVPIIAVSSFMLFLPLVFYCSNYLHSEQKKRKLIEPKRAKSSQSLMNIQDKLN